MKQLNGPGAKVGFFSALCAAMVAECIPAMLAFTAVAVGGAAWDIGHGNWVGNKKRPGEPKLSRGTKKKHHTYYNRLKAGGQCPAFGFGGKK